MESLSVSLQVSGVEFVASRTLFLLDAKISDLPSYLRIDCIEFELYTLSYEEFQQYTPLFQQLKPAIIGSHLILDIYKMVDREFDSFLKGKLLPLFDCCGRYKFRFKSFKCNPKEISAFVASLLQLPSIAASVGIEFDVTYRPRKRSETNNAASLPIEAISNWLHKPVVAAGSIKKIREKRYFRFQFSNIENMSAMVDHLKKVGSRNFLFLVLSFTYRYRGVERILKKI